MNLMILPDLHVHHNKGIRLIIQCSKCINVAVYSCQCPYSCTCSYKSSYFTGMKHELKETNLSTKQV